MIYNIPAEDNKPPNLENHKDLDTKEQDELKEVEESQELGTKWTKLEMSNTMNGWLIAEHLSMWQINMKVCVSLSLWCLLWYQTDWQGRTMQFIFKNKDQSKELEEVNWLCGHKSQRTTIFGHYGAIWTITWQITLWCKDSGPASSCRNHGMGGIWRVRTRCTIYWRPIWTFCRARR